MICNVEYLFLFLLYLSMEAVLDNIGTLLLISYSTFNTPSVVSHQLTAIILIEHCYRIFYAVLLTL